MIYLAQPSSYTLDEETRELVMIFREAPAPDDPDPVSFVSHRDHEVRIGALFGTDLQPADAAGA